MRRIRDPEARGHQADLHAIGEASRPPQVRLHDPDASAGDQIPERLLPVAVLAGRDRDVEALREADVILDPVRRKRFLEPAAIEFLVAPSAAQGLAEIEGLVRIHHERNSVADHLAHGLDASDVVGKIAAADLDLVTVTDDVDHAVKIITEAQAQRGEYTRPTYDGE